MPGSTAFLRRQLLVDTEVQTVLLRRAAVYALAAITYFVTIVVIEESLLYEDRPLSTVLAGMLDQMVYWLPGLLMLAPMMLYDLLRVTNRFAGPMYSLRREMQRLVDGDSRRPVFFRDGDYWNDLAASFNKLREEMLDLRQRAEQSAREEVHVPDYGGIQPVERLFTDDEDNDGLPGGGEDPLAGLGSVTASDDNPALASESDPERSEGELSG